MVRDNRHDSAYLFGALCPALGVGAAIIMPAVNTEAMNEHLKDISAQVTKGAHAVLVLDGAGWRFLIDDPDRIISIGTRQWATVSGYEGWY